MMMHSTVWKPCRLQHSWNALQWEKKSPAPSAPLCAQILGNETPFLQKCAPMALAVPPAVAVKQLATCTRSQSSAVTRRDAKPKETVMTTRTLQHQTVTSLTRLLVNVIQDQCTSTETDGSARLLHRQQPQQPYRCSVTWNARKHDKLTARAYIFTSEQKYIIKPRIKFTLYAGMGIKYP